MALIGLLALAGSIGVVSVVSSASPASATTDSGLDVPTVTGPERAEVQFLVETVSNISLTTATYDATFYLGLRCSPTCRSTPLDIVNATDESRVLVSEDDESSWWKITATMLFAPELRTHPFDTQILYIAVQSSAQSVDRLQFATADRGSASGLAAPIPGWLAGEPQVSLGIVDYPMLAEQYSEIRFEIPIHQSVLAAILTHFVPLSAFVILGVAVLALNRVHDHIRVAGTALIGLTVFYLATSGRVASAGYLTVWDLCIALAYVALCAVMVCGVVGAHLSQRGRYVGDDGSRLDARVRLSFFLVTMGIIVVGGLGIIAFALR